MERVIVRVGDAVDILDAAGAIPLSELGDRPAVVLAAFRTPGAKTDDSEWWDRGKAMLDEIGEVILRLQPRSLLVVLDDPHGVTKKRHLTRLADHLVDEASMLSSNGVGKDLTAIGVVVSDADDRTVVAERVAEFAQRPIRLGNGVVLPASRLRRLDFRACIGEELL